MMDGWGCVIHHTKLTQIRVPAIQINSSLTDVIELRMDGWGCAIHHAKLTQIRVPAIQINSSLTDVIELMMNGWGCVIHHLKLTQIRVPAIQINSSLTDVIELMMNGWGCVIHHVKLTQIRVPAIQINSSLTDVIELMMNGWGCVIHHLKLTQIRVPAIQINSSLTDVIELMMNGWGCVIHHVKLTQIRVPVSQLITHCVGSKSNQGCSNGVCQMALCWGSGVLLYPALLMYTVLHVGRVCHGVLIQTYCKSKGTDQMINHACILLTTIHLENIQSNPSWTGSLTPSLTVDGWWLSWHKSKLEKIWVTYLWSRHPFQLL